MQIEIWSLGKANEAIVDDAISHYLRKVKPWNSVSLEIIPPPKNAGVMKPEAMIRAEEELILNRLGPQHYLIVLDERGKQLGSPEWAAQLQALMNQRVKTLVLLIGGAYGIGEGVKQQAKQSWSLSKLVFPHQLVRLIVTEQVYRAFSILNNSSYHHA